jgi:hypothetical protein
MEQLENRWTDFYETWHLRMFEKWIVLYWTFLFNCKSYKASVEVSLVWIYKGRVHKENLGVGGRVMVNASQRNGMRWYGLHSSV